MFYKKIKNFLLILISLSIICGTSFAVDKNVVNEEDLLQNVQIAKSKNKKEKALKKLFYYYANIKRWDDVIAVSDDLLKYKLTKKEKYTVYYNLARAYMNNKKFESSVEAAQEAEYLYPKKIDVKMLMGDIYMDNSLYELAASKFKNVLELDDKHVTASINLGNIYKLQENYGQALEYYEKAMSLRKNLAPEVYINAAISYKEAGKTDEAIKILKNLKVQNKKSSLLLADIYKRKKKFTSAKDVLRSYVYGKDLDLEIYCNLAEIYIFSKDYGNAKKLLMYYKDKSNNKNIEAIDFLLAEVYYETGKHKKAIKIMNNILKYTTSDYIKDMVKRTLKVRKYKNN